MKMKKRKMCEIPDCNVPAKRRPGQEPKKYCDDHLWQINHAVVRGNAAAVRARLGVKVR